MNAGVARSHAVRPKCIQGVDEQDEWQGLAAKIKEGAKKQQDLEQEGPLQQEEQIDMNSYEGEDEEFGKRQVRKLHDPKLPSEHEVREHSLSGHMPFRSWCPHCVRGRGKEMDHKKQGDEEEAGIPEYHLDYCFPGDSEGERLTVLVVVERYTKMKKAVVVPKKGSTGSYAARMVLELMNECGDKDREVIVKSDQEPAIQFLVDDICTNRTGAKTIKEASQKYSKGSNGVVERAVQSVEQCEISHG